MCPSTGDIIVNGYRKAFIDLRIAQINKKISAMMARQMSMVLVRTMGDLP